MSNKMRPTIDDNFTQIYFEHIVSSEIQNSHFIAFTRRNQIIQMKRNDQEKDDSHGEILYRRSFRDIVVPEIFLYKNSTSRLFRACCTRNLFHFIAIAIINCINIYHIANYVYS